MKKFFALIPVLGIMLGSTVTVFAEQSVNIDLNNATCGCNRIVEIEVVAQSSSKLCAATFEFTYDKNMFEYRSVQSADKNTTVKANELENSVMAVYLNPEGTDISGAETIFTIKLKAIKSGVGYVDFTVSDCVDSNVQSIAAGKCTSSKITVRDGKSESNGNSGGSKSGGSKEKSPTGSGKSSRKGEETATSNSSIDEFGLLNPISEQNSKLLIIGIALGAGAVIAVLLAFFTGKHSSDKKRSEKQ